MAVVTRKYTHEDSTVSSELKFWGYHNGKGLAWEGYSVENTIARLLHGWGGEFSDRVLMRDFPDTERGQRMARKWWHINAIISSFPESLRRVLIARYCVPPKEIDGVVTYHTRAELAKACGISEHEYRKRLGEAKRRYKLVIFPVDNQYMRMKQ